MHKDITAKCEVCVTCNEMKPNQPKEPMLSYPVPTYPFELISSDCMEFNNKFYIVLVDHYSDYIEVEQISSPNASATIKFMQKVFSTHGIPRMCITDNGTNYTSTDFKTFMSKYDIEHVTSSPHYPKSNGRGEAAVKVAKNLLKRANMNNEPFWIAMLNQRNTPTRSMESSPVQRCMSRRTRTTLPADESQYKPKLTKHVKQNLQKRKSRNKKYYDKQTHPLPQLTEGQYVRVQTKPQLSNNWTPGVVTDIGSTPRSYKVNIPSTGATLERNRIHIRETKEQSNSNEETDMTTSTNDAIKENHNCDIESNHTGNPVATTRSGRLIKKPSRYMDLNVISV